MSKDRRLEVILLLVVTLKLLFHAVYLPVFEGPDEPFHLGRVLPLDHSQSDTGELYLQASIADSVAAHPCADDLRRVFGCKAFEGSGAFNILGPHAPPSIEGPRVGNYEAHQPPTFYLLASLVVRLTSTTMPIAALLLVRIVAVCFVVFGLYLVARVSSPASVLLALLLLLPGAGESLARVSNDPLVLLASATLLFALSRHLPQLSIPTIAIAPTIKLTALPFVVAALIQLWGNRQRKLAVAGAIASLLVVPLQAIRGWSWGGTVEMNQTRFGFEEPIIQSVIGLGRSIYTIAKTTIWLGNWSFFRAPVGLLVAILALVVITLAFCRRRGTTTSLSSFLGGLLVLGAGVVAFSVAHRSLFGQWGGVGGWYVWGLMPWLAVGLTENLALAESARRYVLAATVLLVTVSNGLWLRSAAAIYGFA